MHFWKQRELLKNDFFSIYDCVGVCNIHDSSFFFAFQLVSNCNLSKNFFDIFALPFPKKILKCIHWDFFCVCIKGVEFLLPLFFPEKNAWQWRWSPNICIWVVVWLFSPEGHHWPQKLLMVFLSSWLHSESIEQTCKTIKAAHSNSPSLR